MGIIIFALVTAMVGLGFVVYGAIMDDMEYAAPGILCMVIGMVGIVVMGAFANDSLNEARFESDYVYVMNLESKVKNGETLKNKDKVDAYVLSQSLNKEIETNRKYCNNFWIGICYSDEIGLYEPFDCNIFKK